MNKIQYYVLHQKNKQIIEWKKNKVIIDIGILLINNDRMMIILDNKDEHKSKDNYYLINMILE